MILYNVAKFSVRSRSALVVYSRTSSSRFIVASGESPGNDETPGSARPAYEVVVGVS